MRWRPALCVLPALWLAGCSVGQQSAVKQSPQQSFTSENYGITITYPADFHAQAGFSGSYLQNGAWKSYAGPRSKGRPIVALILDGSNDVSDAELRIGASRDAHAVATCTQHPDAMRSARPGHAMLDGVRFVTWKAGDAAMSHYLLVHSYRAVYDGACYAIDLLVYGTNPKVYAPPRTPPFTHKDAFAQLQAALKGFRFSDR